METRSLVRLILVAALLAVPGCGGGESQPEDAPGVPLVATLGDSITAGALRWSPNPALRKLLVRGRPTPRSQWQHWAERAAGGGYRFRNCGVEGERTDQIELRLEECADGAEVVVVQGGTNDIVQGHAPAVAAANLREIVQRAQDSGLRALLTTVLPINDRYPEWAPEVRRLNELIFTIARAEGVAVVDFFELLADPRRPDRILPRWTDDGVHPTVKGYARLGRAVARKLE